VTKVDKVLVDKKEPETGAASAFYVEHRGGLFASKEPDWLVRQGRDLRIAHMGRDPGDWGAE
jgi:hypothetical protein